MQFRNGTIIMKVSYKKNQM
uniref:Uncharacterized protein n=1 Tax=Arundo donax TaxID=35708 RepID=A0A0A8ZYJ4_ARUDO